MSCKRFIHIRAAFPAESLEAVRLQLRGWYVFTLERHVRGAKRPEAAIVSAQLPSERIRMNSRTVVSRQDSVCDQFNLGTPPATRNSVAGEESVIDLLDLLQRCLDDATFCGMILHKFVNRSADQLAAMERALEAGNMQELAREAHTLQGVAANLSAACLRSRAEALENAVRQNDLSGARQALDETRSEIVRCTTIVPELMDRLAL